MRASDASPAIRSSRWHVGLIDAAPPGGDGEGVDGIRRHEKRPASAREAGRSLSSPKRTSTHPYVDSIVRSADGDCPGGQSAATAGGSAVDACVAGAGADRDGAAVGAGRGVFLVLEARRFPAGCRGGLACGGWSSSSSRSSCVSSWAGPLRRASFATASLGFAVSSTSSSCRCRNFRLR